MTLQVLLGLLGGAFALLDPWPYLRDVLRGTTRPHRGARLIWATLGCIALAAQAASGGGWSLVVVGVQAVTTTFTLVLSLRGGEGGTTWPELALLGLAAAGVAGWLLLDTPVVATCCVVLADAVGFALMLPKAWHRPWTETASTYVLAGLSGACAVGAVGSVDVAVVLYPAWFAVSNLALGTLLMLRRYVLQLASAAGWGRASAPAGSRAGVRARRWAPATGG